MDQKGIVLFAGSDSGSLVCRPLLPVHLLLCNFRGHVRLQELRQAGCNRQHLQRPVWPTAATFHELGLTRPQGQFHVDKHHPGRPP